MTFFLLISVAQKSFVLVMGLDLGILGFWDFGILGSWDLGILGSGDFGILGFVLGFVLVNEFSL